MRPALEVLRSKVRSYMTETGVVERRTGETLFDEETGQSTRVRVTVYEGPCLVRPQYRVSEEEAGGATVVVGRYDVMLPADAPVIRGDVLTVSDATFDPGPRRRRVQPARRPRRRLAGRPVLHGGTVHLASASTSPAPPSFPWWARPFLGTASFCGSGTDGSEGP